MGISLKNSGLLSVGVLLTGLSTLALAQSNSPAPQVISGSGDIQPNVQQFQQLLGPGSEELNWDGIPDELAAPNFLPGEFFNAESGPQARGAILSTPGQGVQVSADSENPTGTPPRFGNINPEYEGIFKTYSPERLFSPIGSNIVDLTFAVPGTGEPAFVQGFGAVYTDVDSEHTAFEYFDQNGNSLGQFAVPPADGGVSFLGVYFASPVISRVRITYGTVPLGPIDAADTDVAVMDNFYYSAPQPQ